MTCDIQQLRTLTSVVLDKPVQPPFKGDGNPDDYYVYMKDLNKPRVLIPVSFKSVEKCRSCRHLNICKWIVMEAAIL